MIRYVLLTLFLPGFVEAEEPTIPLPRFGERLSEEQVEAFARLALKGILIEYPNKPSNVITGPDQVLSPKAMHPAFYGCFDWHSSVHGHWMLLRLLRQYPDAPVATEISALLESQLTKGKIDQEVLYFEKAENKSFERMYGWAWALRLAAELHEWNDERSHRWGKALEPLERLLANRIGDYLPRLTWPIRTGVHPDTAFALSQIIDYARLTKNASLASLATARARDYFVGDTDYQARYEPSGEDFFSPGLNEADLMRRVLSPEDFPVWLGKFLPELPQGKAGNLLTPVAVSDVTDGKLVHLAGLNLSRAWTLNGIASALPKSDSRHEVLERSAAEHLDAGLGYVFSGHYEGEHWLATFAVYALEGLGVQRHP